MVLAIGPNGNVYVTRREEGDILMFRVGTDGLAAGQPVRVASRSGLHGIAFSKGKVYLASVSIVLFDQAIQEAAAKLTALGDLEKYAEKQMAGGMPGLGPV